MVRKSATVLSLALLAFFIILVGSDRNRTALAQDAVKTCTLEGTMVDSEGEPLISIYSQFELMLDGQSVGNYHTLNGGRYHVEGLKKESIR